MGRSSSFQAVAVCVVAVSRPIGLPLEAATRPYSSSDARPLPGDVLDQVQISASGLKTCKYSVCPSFATHSTFVYNQAERDEAFDTLSENVRQAVCPDHVP